MHWVDNFHTAYVLDCFKYYAESTGDRQFEQNMSSGYEYWKRTFFLEDGNRAVLRPQDSASSTSSATLRPSIRLPSSLIATRKQFRSL